MCNANLARSHFILQVVIPIWIEELELEKLPNQAITSAIYHVCIDNDFEVLHTGKERTHPSIYFLIRDWIGAIFKEPFIFALRTHPYSLVSVPVRKSWSLVGNKISQWGVQLRNHKYNNGIREDKSFWFAHFSPVRGKVKW